MVSSRRAPNSPIHCTKENTRAPPPRRMYTLSFKSFEEVEKLRMKMFPRIIQRNDIGKNYYLSDLELFFNRKNPRLLLRAIRITIINIFTIHPLFDQRKEKVWTRFCTQENQARNFWTAVYIYLHAKPRHECIRVSAHKYETQQRTVIRVKTFFLVVRMKRGCCMDRQP